MDKYAFKPVYCRIIALLLGLALCFSLSCQTRGKLSARVADSSLLTRVASEELRLDEVAGKKWNLPADLEGFGLPLSTFNTNLALSHIRYLSENVGPRPEGTSREKEAAEYIKKEFLKMGYPARIQAFTLPNGRSSQNIIASKESESHLVRVVIGAHIDTKGSSPGANDNASGVAVMLEVARAIKKSWLSPSVDFVAFGAEEMIDKNPDHHHYGSRYYVSQLSSPSSVVGMISLDMVGVGPSFREGYLRAISRPLATSVAVEGNQLGYSVGYYDIGKRSDHEPFEEKGIPGLWIGWRKDPYYHTPRDTSDKISSTDIKATGQMVLKWLVNLRGDRLEALRKSH